jgi:hypothetical protein
MNQTENYVQILDLEDSEIQLHYNPNLTNKPFLLRIYSMDNNPFEIRLKDSELDLINSFIYSMMQSCEITEK